MKKMEANGLIKVGFQRKDILSSTGHMGSSYVVIVCSHGGIYIYSFNFVGLLKV